MAGTLKFTEEEMERIEKARQLVGIDTISYAEFIHQATMQMVDEVLGTNDALVQERRRVIQQRTQHW